MKLLTKEIENSLPDLSAVLQNDPVVHVKYFTPWGNWTWYGLSGKRHEDDFVFFGYVVGFENEFGYFSLNELKEIKGFAGLGIERDLYFDKGKLTDVLKREGHDSVKI
jgi:hypothetical protein